MNAVTDLTTEKATFPVKMRALLIIDSYGKILGENFQVERSAIVICMGLQFVGRLPVSLSLKDSSCFPGSIFSEMVCNENNSPSSCPSRRMM
jgi:hypothetical protein